MENRTEPEEAEASGRTGWEDDRRRVQYSNMFN